MRYRIKCPFLLIRDFSNEVYDLPLFYSLEFYEDSGYGYNEGYSYAGPRTRGGGRGGGMISYPPIRSSQPSRGGEMGNGQSNHAIRMRGLPYSAKEKDVKDFFSPQVPTRIHIEFDDFGRPSGEGEVTFSTHEDAVAGMSNNNKHMGEFNWVWVWVREGGGGEREGGREGRRERAREREKLFG